MSRRSAQWLDADETPKNMPKLILHLKNIMVSVWWYTYVVIHTSFLKCGGSSTASWQRETTRYQENCPKITQLALWDYSSSFILAGFFSNLLTFLKTFRPFYDMEKVHQWNSHQEHLCGVSSVHNQRRRVVWACGARVPPIKSKMDSSPPPPCNIKNVFSFWFFNILLNF